MVSSAHVKGRKTADHSRGVVFSLLKCLLGSYILTAVLLMLLAFLLYRFDLTERPVSVAIIIIYVLSTIFAGFLVGKRMQNRKFLWGLCLGIGYFTVLALASLVMGNGSAALGNAFFTTLALCAGGGMLGGMLS